MIGAVGFFESGFVNSPERGANAKRRQMTKGSLAMIGAMGFVPNSGNNSDKSRGRPESPITVASRMTGVTHETMRKAFLVKEHAPDLAQTVIDGGLTLDAAHDTAQARKREAEWRDNGLVMLRKEAPDLAARVADRGDDCDNSRLAFHVPGHLRERC